MNQEELEAEPKKREHLKRNIILAVVAVVVVIAGLLTWAFAVGVVAPPSAAARYGVFKYIEEQDVTDYIETYKTQMGYGDATDDEWAQFLAAYNLTPDRLRLSTVRQLLSDIAVKEKCASLGITVTDAEVDAAVENLKESLAFNDDTIFMETLAQYGQTLEGLKETYRQQLLQTKLCSQEVSSPEPTDDQVRSYIKSAAQSYASDQEQENGAYDYSIGWELKQSYCFAIQVSGSEATLEDRNKVEYIKQEFVDSGMNYSNFYTLLQMYCNIDDLKDANGAMGWNVDTSEYSEAYLKELNNTPAGSVSNVFTDGDTVCFIWVDQSFTIPRTDEGLQNLDLSTLPTSLRQYFSDCVSYSLWQSASSEYIQNLVASYDVTLYSMPSDVPYNVDMSKYLVSDSTESDSSSSS